MASYLKKVKDTYKSHYESDTNIQAVMTLMHGKRAVEKTAVHIGFVTFLHVCRARRHIFTFHFYNFLELNSKFLEKRLSSPSLLFQRLHSSPSPFLKLFRIVNWIKQQCYKKLK